MSNLINLKALIEREYVKSLIEDIDEMNLTQDEKDNLLADKLDEAEIDLRSVIMWRKVAT